MENKKQQEEHQDLTQIFDVHTMKKDADALMVADSTPAVADAKSLHINKTEKRQERTSIANPFLDTQNDAAKNHSKELDKTTNPFIDKTAQPLGEKSNDTTVKIADKSQKKAKNMLHVVMIVFVAVFLIGAIVFGAYVLFEQRGEKTSEEVTQDTAVDMNTMRENNGIDTDAYAMDLPNYFSFDVESATAKEDIMAQLQKIAQNLQQSSTQEPISFIVTDQKDNPVSFHIFALSAGFILPEEIMMHLEEGFKIYAYNDPSTDVRFGLAVDVKDASLLQENLKTKENMLPGGLATILRDAVIPAAGITFSDSVYNTHPIRYVNLDAAEMYSVDYTISGQQFVVGTSKNTLRAMLDDIKKETVIPADDAQ